MRALVTGARGFVGSWLTAHLVESGDDVVGIDHEVEITDGEAVRAAVLGAAPDVVYHLAALTSVGRSWIDPSEVLQVNAIGTLYVLEAARACPHPPRVLLTSSAEVYGAVPEELLPVTEDAPLAPVTPYAASKVAAEYLGVQAHLAYGLPVLRMRPFNHVGPGQSTAFVVSALAQRIVEARRSGADSIVTGNLTARRDLTDVRDVVRAYRLLAELGVAGEVYNVCSGRDIAIAEVAKQLQGLAGVDLEFELDPALARPVDVPVVRGDFAKLREATGWEPHLSLERTLRDVLEQADARVG
ncbi:MAG: GDP-mannose 4,6-dehydratase [Acidimicrobiales bacterium]